MTERRRSRQESPCILVSGHSVGLQVVRVPTRRGWIVLASDATHFWANIRTRSPFPIVVDMAKMLEGYQIVESLADGPDHIIPGHDPLLLARFPCVPGQSDVLRLDLPPDRLMLPFSDLCYASRCTKDLDILKPSSKTSVFGSTHAKSLPGTSRASRKKSITSCSASGLSRSTLAFTTILRLEPLPRMALFDPSPQLRGMTVSFPASRH